MAIFHLQHWCLVVFLLVAAAGCASADATVPATPLPAGMDFAEASTVYEIVPAASEARFLIGEILRGEPITVVGKTNQIQGQIALDPDNPATAAVGPIQVNARTLATDNGFRNRAIETRILLSRVFEFVTFTPTAVSGLPATISAGETVPFQIAGDLTITDVTRPVVFEATATLVTDTRIEGRAQATIQRNDFNLFVPSATGVAGVEEAVVLEIDFVAEAQE